MIDFDLSPNKSLAALLIESTSPIKLIVTDHDFTVVQDGKTFFRTERYSQPVMVGMKLYEITISKKVEDLNKLFSKSNIVETSFKSSANQSDSQKDSANLDIDKEIKKIFGSN